MEWNARLFMQVSDVFIWKKFVNLESILKKDYPDGQCVPDGFNNFINNPNGLFFSSNEYGEHEWGADISVLEAFASAAAALAKDDFILIADTDNDDGEVNPFIACYFGGDQSISGFVGETVESLNVSNDANQGNFDEDDSEDYSDDDLGEDDFSEDDIQRAGLRFETLIANPEDWINFCVKNKILKINDKDKAYLKKFAISAEPAIV